MVEYLAQYHMFHSSSEDAAAHQPEDSFPYAGFARTANDNADHAIVTENIH